MDVTGIVLAAVTVGTVGLFIGIFLGISNKKFAVETDEREEAVLAALPGNNCGGCGYAGCSGLAAAIVSGEAEVGACPVGGAPVAGRIGAIMGVDAGEQERMTAFVKCGGVCGKTETLYDYHGIKDCVIASQMANGGSKGCVYGCLGYGSCVDVCPFDAVHIVDGVAQVDREACKACGKCIDICPKHLIEMIPYRQKSVVQCNSNEKGKALMEVCQAGCIGCRICEKNCVEGAISVKDFLAHIDAEKCSGCGICAEKCPRKTIKMQN